MTNRPRKLLNIDRNAKTVKGQKKGYLTAILYLAPYDLSGYQVCPQASKGCAAACLNTAGRAGIIKRGEKSNSIQDARIAKTRWYFEDRAGFLAQLDREITRFVGLAYEKGLKPAIRLNGTSDIPWERIKHQGQTFMELFPNVQFYDYTKITKRALACARGEFPSNYALTFSATEDNRRAVWQVLGAGGNVAVVFKDVPRNYTFGPRTAWDHVPVTYRVVDGDETDLRFLDDSNVIVGLKAKGKARQDQSGFVWS